MLRARLFLLVFIPLTFVFALSAIICSLFDRSGALYHRHARGWSRVALWLAGVRLEVVGAEKVPHGTPVIFMSNHQGNFDILALFHAIPQRFSWIAKEELFKIPVFGHSMARAGYIPLNRGGDGRRALKSVEAAAAAIRGGRSVVIFPEGTRTADGELLPFKKGGFLLACKAGVPIVPLTINGSMQINPKNRIELYPGTIRIVFADPILTSGDASKERERLMAEVRQAIDGGLER
ncbi:MAG TPA: lysophospholipid acyltransferase family protein [Geobacteraceae bacterium]|jgi:1-acyl-sn-glycerol-3-phosphate acyltransferase|nr:lysophospholipid acyltransferase family protein [Geobacteraceae bacterium]